MSVVSKLMFLLRWMFARVRMRPNDILVPAASDLVFYTAQKLFPDLYKKIHFVSLERKVQCCRKNYAKRFWEIRRRLKCGNKIKILILAQVTSKWKCKSLYKLLENDERFEISVGIVKPYITTGRTIVEIATEYESIVSWFSSRGYRCVRLYNPRKDKSLKITGHGFDVVLYTCPWYNVAIHMPDEISKQSLAFYIPYYVPAYVDINVDCRMDSHRLFWRHIVLNSDISSKYTNATRDRKMAGKFIPLGHPMLDIINDDRQNRSSKRRKCAIYAPHWTFEHPANQTIFKISTFSENWRLMLDFAKEHPKVDWVFKPHPGLYRAIISSGFMAKEEADNYYNEWRRLGGLCDDGDYVEIFAKSDLMITDCGSFLGEYGATGKPVIYLVSKRNKLVPPKAIADAFGTYYHSHNNEDLLHWLDIVLLKGLDPNAAKRIHALKIAGFAKSNSAVRIRDYILDVCRPQCK